MSLLSALEGAATDKAPGWVSDLTGKAKALASDKLRGTEAEPVLAALDKIEDRSEALGAIGAGALVSVLAYMALGDDEAAELAFLRDSATLSERLAASRSATADTVREAHNRHASWGEIEELAKELGPILLKLLPILLLAV